MFLEYILNYLSSYKNLFEIFFIMFIIQLVENIILKCKYNSLKKHIEDMKGGE